MPISTSHPRSALLILDPQNDFSEGGSLEVPDANAIYPILNNLKNRDTWYLTVISQDWHPADHVSFQSNHKDVNLFDEITLEDETKQVMWPDHCIQNSRGAEFHPDLDISTDDVIVQKGTDVRYDSYSAFKDNSSVSKTELADTLKQNGITKVYVCGLATDYCVGFTALDALSEGFDTYVIEDACRGIDNDGITKMFDDIKSKGGHIVTSGSL